MPQKDMYPGCALAYLSVPLRLVRNGQVFQTELGGVPLFDLERPDLCLNVSELLEMIQRSRRGLLQDAIFRPTQKIDA